MLAIACHMHASFIPTLPSQGFAGVLIVVLVSLMKRSWGGKLARGNQIQTYELEREKKIVKRREGDLYRCYIRVNTLLTFLL